jgi:hypothetical protein
VCDHRHNDHRGGPDSRRTAVVVAPITHRAPVAPDQGIEVPAKVKRFLGLDAAPSWVILTELNRFIWPGFDLSRIPGTGDFAYGMLPPRLFEQIRKRILELDAGLRRLTSRD